MWHRSLFSKVVAKTGWVYRYLLSMLLCCLVLVNPSRANEQRFNETELKAAYLYNFAYFVTWPETNRDFLFCSYANSPVTTILARLIVGERVHDRAIQLLIDPVPAQLHECHVIYIPAQQERILAATLEFVRAFPVLTVSDIADFEDRGGMIRLATEDMRIQPVIRLKNVTRSGLGISSKLLRSSRVIE